MIIGLVTMFCMESCLGEKCVKDGPIEAATAEEGDVGDENMPPPLITTLLGEEGEDGGS